jgi:subtilisin family serine protease
MKGILTIAFLIVAAMASAQSQLVAQLVAGASPAAVAQTHNITLADVTSGAPFALFTLPAGVDPEAMQTELNADSRVVWAEDNMELSDPEGQSAIKGSTIPAIGDRFALYAANTHVLEQINWSSKLANSPGRRVRVAVLDTGLSRFQSYLWAKVDASANYIDKNARSADDVPRNQDSNHNGTPDDAVGHGTMVAGIIDQVAPMTRFVIARVADSDGSASAWTIIKGLAFAVVNRAEVANISLGSAERIPALTDVLDWCEANHLLVVSGSGNANVDRAFYPARISKVICVTGLDPQNIKADFSNWDGAARSAAPATGIVSQWWDGHMGVWSGTSFSAPMVAGAIADCLRRISPNVDLGDIRDVVEVSGRDLDVLNPDFRGELGTLLDVQRLNLMLGG